MGTRTGGFLARELGLRAPFLMAGICQIFVAALAATIARNPARSELPISNKEFPTSK